MRIEHVFNRGRRDVLALGSFEQLLHAASQPQQPVGRALALVTGAKKTILGKHFGIQIGALVIAHHPAGRLDQDLTFFAQAYLHTRHGCAHAARRGLPHPGCVRVGKVLGHAVGLHEVQAHTSVPGNQLWRDGRRATGGQQHLIQAQSLEDFAGHDAPNNRDAQQPVQLLGRHLLKYALLKLQPQTRNRLKHIGPCPVQVLQKSVQRIGKVNVRTSVYQGDAFNACALVNMG